MDKNVKIVKTVKTIKTVSDKKKFEKCENLEKLDDSVNQSDINIERLGQKNFLNFFSQSPSMKTDETEGRLSGKYTMEGRLLEKKLQGKVRGSPKSGKKLSGKPTTPLKKVIKKPKYLGTAATKGGEDIRRHFPVKNVNRKFKLIENFVGKLKENEGSSEVVNFVENSLKISKKNIFEVSKGAEPSHHTQPDKMTHQGMARNVPSNNTAKQEDQVCVSQMGERKLQGNCDPPMRSHNSAE